MKTIYKKLSNLLDKDTNNIVPAVMLVLMFASAIYISVNNIKL